MPENEAPINIKPIAPPIERMKPMGKVHSVVQKDSLANFTEVAGATKGMQDLAGFLRDTVTKNPGTDPLKVRADHNPHLETFVISDKLGIRVVNLADLQAQLETAGLEIQILGVQSIGNPHQKVEAMVQGINSDDPKSGFERPTLAEGPNVVLAPYAFDQNGHLHVFRTLQYRTGEVVVDTPRGFADHNTLVEGKPLDDLDNAEGNVRSNLERIVGEETGDVLDIKKIVYLGSPRANTTFVTSTNGFFGVEVDYDKFMRNSKIISVQELERRREQFDHEGIMGSVIDMDMTEYANFKRDSSISRDLDADGVTDIVVIDFLAKRIEDLERRAKTDRDRLHDEVGVLRELKNENPEAYEAYKNVRATFLSSKITSKLQ